MASPAFFASSTFAIRGPGLAYTRFSSFSSVATMGMSFSGSFAVQLDPVSRTNTSTMLYDDDASIENWHGSIPFTSSALPAVVSNASAQSKTSSTSSTSIRSTTSASSLASTNSTVLSSTASTSGTSRTSTSTSSHSRTSTRPARAKVVSSHTSARSHSASVDPLRNSIPFPRIGTTPSLIRRGAYRNPSALSAVTVSAPSSPWEKMVKTTIPLPSLQVPSQRNNPTMALIRPTAAPTSFLHTTFADAMYQGEVQLCMAPSKGIPCAWRRQRKASTFRRS
ncbi:hypothetical protein JCM11251_003256 [Rhodosporidiobolus azoricus]